MLKTRVVTAIVLAAVLLLALFRLPAAGWSLFCAVLLGAAAWEWCRLVSLSGLVSLVYPLVTACGFFGLSLLEPSGGTLLGLFAASTLFWLVIVPLWLKARWSLRASGHLGLLLGWALLLPAGFALLALREGGWLLLGVLAIAWIADTAAYFTGKAFGRHKLAPAISPGKTWEGAAGALLAVLVYCWLVPKPFAVPVALVFVVAVLLTAVSIAGDLLESLFKRQAGLKDSSNLLPGHGGVLDRVDSLLAVLPVAACIYLGYPLLFAASAG